MTDNFSHRAPASVGLGMTILRILIPLAALGALFAGGAWVYTHLVGKLLFQAQSTSVLPTDLVLALAVLAGAASFFSPCSLAITPAFLTYFVQRDSHDGQSTGTRKLFAAAVWIALGILGISAIAGALVVAIGALVYNVLIYLIPLVGLVFVVLGGLLLLGRGGSLGWAMRYLPGYRTYERLMREATGNSRSELIAFGAAYGAASHSCTLPVVIGMLMLPLAAGDYWLAGSALLIYGMALAGLMLLMLTFGQPAVTAMRRLLGSYLQYIIGGLFLVTGGYLLHYFMVNFGLSFGF
jgi:cytochrome c biogenesis protein CcdA